ncbi:MAG TPA: crossover junction endodeoxyribonuclease RuvC, partial [Clostridiales bacterium]|nr:crossover junction endodeoxyribonuclease RuvC [Clostridiales bacterium]
MIILGIDPGMAILGYGVIESLNYDMKLLDYGAVTTSSAMDTPKRLLKIFVSMEELIQKYSPDA